MPPQPPPPPHVVVVGMSVREVEAHERLAGLAACVAGSVAHLQVGDPSLHAELDRLADAGASRVVLVGVSLGTLAPANSWLRRIASHWWRLRAPDAGRPGIEVATTLVTAPTPDSLVRALATTRAVHGGEAGLTSAAWERVPGHRHQVLICRGPRCTALRSDRTAEAFVLALMARDLGDDDVLLTQTACQYPCNAAPVVVVQPDDVWYGGLTPEAVDRVVDEHLVGGNPVADHRLPR